MTYSYTPQGVCSRMISFELDDDCRLHNVRFMGGCNGNAQAISRLCEGMDAQKAADLLSGIRCGMKPTSCPDRLSAAIKQALDEF